MVQKLIGIRNSLWQREADGAIGSLGSHEAGPGIILGDLMRWQDQQDGQANKQKVNLDVYNYCGCLFHWI